MPEFETDVLGEPYTAETIPLADDDEGAVHATLVRRNAAATTRRAVLHVHGFADYFFQTGYAEWWTDRGYDFYALDLRKYGRSIAPHHTPNFVTDLHDYFEEIDEAWSRITERDGHDHVVVCGHSTGGLVLPLWAHARKPDVRGVVLNSPWFDLQGPPWMRTVGTTVIKQVGIRQPRRVIPRKVSGLYGRSLHRDHEGEWDFDLAWKPLESWPVYAGWLAAIRKGHAELQAGIEVGAPALVLSSRRTAWPSEMCEDVHTCDIVLDVGQIRRWAPSVGRHVTLAGIEGAVHDVFLSRKPARDEAYDELARFLSAYVDRG
jgi:alpha-beta hydrolase superfamily lysophospholipase